MEFFSFENSLFAAIVGAAIGSIVTLIFRYVWNRRGVFSYKVQHFRIGISASDPTLGTIEVNWNGIRVNKLYTSTIELKNSSLKDYSDIDVCIYSADTDLLTVMTSIAGSTKVLNFTDSYVALLTGSDIELSQKVYSSQREYNIPTMNRGQIVKFTILNEPKSDEVPTLWLDIVHKGVKVKFNVIQQEIFGVPQPLALSVGLIFSALFLVYVIIFIDEIWLAAALSLVFGLAVLVPGAYAIKTYRWIRSFLAD